ncbi:hypothetical protein JCM10908_006278 [Rhodotorula pacifica]|uniref:uncharacterized protein n=1 Tax=Rhodotorula pacifica TaxID=1495444 RepID=UPI00317A6F5D
MAASGPSRRAWHVEWRNFQGKKNKTWESDGLMLVEGTGITVYSADGKHLGARNITKALAEDDEFSMNGKDFKVGDQASLEEYYQAAGRKGGSFGATTAVSTPAKAVPGYFAKPGQAPAATVDYTSRFSTPAPVRPTMTATEQRDRAETPVSANKSWIQPREKLQKPFKLPGRSPAVAAAAVSANTARYSSPVPSKLRERVLPEQQQRQAPRRNEAIAGPARDKGKGRADSAEETAEDVENSPPSPRSDRRPPAKKPRLEEDRAETAAVAARPARRSAADAAFDFAVSKNRSTSAERTSSSRDLARAPPVRTKSAPDRDRAEKPNAHAQALFRSSTSPTKGVVDTTEPKKEEEGNDVVEEEELALLQDVELDAQIFANVWSDAEEDVKPRLDPEGMDDGDDEQIQDATDAETGKAEAAEVGDTEAVRGKRTYTCLWRKATTAKKADWAGDARLIINGQSARLINDDNDKQLAAWTLRTNTDFSVGEMLKFGGLQIEVSPALCGALSAQRMTGIAPQIQEALTSRNSASSQVAPKVPQTNTAARPRLSVSQGSRAPAFKPPAPAKAVNPLARQVAARSASPVPVPHPPPRETAKLALPPAAAVDFFGKPTLINAARSGDVLRKSGPLFDPEGEGALVMLRPDEAHQAEYNKANAPIVDVVVDPVISSKLRDHQRSGVAFLYECVMGMRSSGQGCILADDMGLGKTIQSIALIWTLLKQNPYQTASQGAIKRAMIVCPVTLIKNWSQEFKKWLGKDRVRITIGDSSKAIETFVYNKSYEVLIVGYEKVREYVELLKVAQPSIGLVICDEGHRLKSDKTKTSKALQSLSCMRRVILSGTPIQNNLSEFYAMLDFVNPGILKDAEYFKKNFERPIMAARQPDASSKQRQDGAEAQETLAAIRSHFVLRRENSVILQHLPAKYEYTVFIRPTALQLEVYRQALGNSAVKQMLEGSDMRNGISLLQTLLKIATSPGLLLKQIQEKGYGHSDESILDPFPKETDKHDFGLSGKFSVLGAMLADLWKCQIEKIVVVSNFTTTLDIIETHCKRNRYPYCRLDGKTPQQDRIPMVDAFNRGPRSRNFVFLLSSKGGGTGLNIIGASRLVQIDSDWNPSNDLQAMARIHREGQTRICVIYRFLTSGTVDEVIYQRQLTKLALSGSIMAGDGTVSSSKNKNAFTLDELRDLFRLHEEAACQTHDLLGCRCHLGEPSLQEADDDDSEDDEEKSSEDEFEAGFVQASQYQDKDADRALARKRRDLSVLKTWSHYSARDIDRMGKIEDVLLQHVFYHALENADPEESLPKLREDDASLCGGQIAFVFGQTAVAPTSSASSPAAGEEE